MNLAEALRRMAAAADTIDGLTCYSYVPDSVEVPAFYTGEVSTAYDQTFGGDSDVEVICRVLTSRADEQSGQAQLLDFMAPTGPRSIKAALEAARGAPGQAALGGACDDLHVRRMQGHRLYTIGQQTYYGAEWIVRLIGEGDGT